MGSTRLREVFPAIAPDYNSLWRANAITIARPTFTRDPSVQALGTDGALLGSRLDAAFLDDVETYASTCTVEGRAKVAGWVRSTVLTRLVSGGRVVVLGPAWHGADLLHTLEADGWPTYRYSVQDDEGRSRWPERWPLARIAAKRVELGRRAAANQLDVVPLAEGGKIDPAWVDAALARGARRPLLPYVHQAPDGCSIVCGVDLAVGQQKHHDRTAIATVFVHRDGHRELVAMESGRWTAPDIVKRIHAVNERFRPVCILVESNAAQMYIVQMTRQLASVPVRPYTTGGGTRSLHYGVDGLSVELERGQWTIRGGRPRGRGARARGLLLRPARSRRRPTRSARARAPRGRAAREPRRVLSSRLQRTVIPMRSWWNSSPTGRPNGLTFR